MAPQLSPEESVALIKANLAEVLNPEIIDDVVLVQKRPLKIYWGTATTGKPHCGYFVPMMKIAEFLAAGCEITVLLADVHGFLDHLDMPMEIMEHRAKYYECCIKGLLTALGVDIKRLKFVKGSTYQLHGKYNLDEKRLAKITRVAVAQKAGAEVVKQTSDPTIGGLTYPLMQALDEEHLGVDAQFGGIDQRKIFAFAIENLPRIGYKIRAHLMNAMVPGLGEAAKMSASDADSKIDLLDSPEDVKKKLKKAKCVPKEVEGNGVVAFVEHVIMRALALTTGTKTFTVQRHEGEPLVYETPEKLKDDYAADILTPQLLKAAVTEHLNTLLAPIRAEYAASNEWQAADVAAYPPPAIIKKEKKAKDKGDPAKRAAAAAAAKKGGAEGSTVAADLNKLVVKDS